MEPQLTKCQGTGESCSLSRVRYIEHLDLMNFLKKKKKTTKMFVISKYSN